MSKQSAAEQQVAEKALAAVKDGRALVKWDVQPEIEAGLSDGPIATLGTVLTHDTGRRHYEVTIQWTE